MEGKLPKIDKSNLFALYKAQWDKNYNFGKTYITITDYNFRALISIDCAKQFI